MTSNKSIYLFLLFACLLISASDVVAQKKQSKANELTTIKEFVQVSSFYQQLPLYVNMEVERATNFITSEEDTSLTQAEFYFDKNNSYMRYGNTEQLVNDSLALIISHQIERMYLSPHSQSVEDRLKFFSGMQLKDSSVETLTKKYASESSTSGALSSIVLTSRNLLSGTSSPKEAIELQYDSKTKLLKRTVMLSRRLLPLDEETFRALSSDSSLKNMLVTIENKAHFLVKEEQTLFEYKQIKYGPVKFPATIKERISKNEEGEYVPVKTYENYTVTIN